LKTAHTRYVSNSCRSTRRVAEQRQACFIFRAGGTRKVGKERPAKKRKLNGTALASQSFPRLSQHGDPDGLAQRRWELFDHLWRSHKSDTTQDEVDEDSLTQLTSFLLDASNSSQRQKLSTALLLTGLDIANYESVLRRVSTESPRLGKSVLIDLQTRMCPNLQTALKNLIKGVIIGHSGVDGYNDYLARHKRLLPLNFDLELLEQFLSDHSISQVTVSLSDAETFDSHVMNELVHTLCLWQDRIPFTLMLGITSTRELFEHRISKSCLKRMEARTFNFAPRSHLISDLLSGEQDSEEPAPQIFLDSTVMSVLSDVNQMHGKSAQSLNSMIQYLYMSHFFANPIASLAQTDITSLGGEDQKHLARAVRSTDSFKVFCENLLAEKDQTSNARVRRLLNDDKALLQEVKDRVQEGQTAYDASRRVIRSFAGLCCALLREDLRRPNLKLEIEIQLSRAMYDLTNTEAYDEAVGRIQDFSPATLLQILKGLPAEIGSTLDLSEVVNALQSQLHHELIPNGSTSHDTGASVADANGDGVSALAPSTPSKRGKTARSSKPTSQVAKKGTTIDSPAKADLLVALKHKLQTSSLDVSSLLLHEAYVLSSRTTRFKPSFKPHPRAAIERALLRPSDYLGWHRGRENSESDGSDTEDDHQRSIQQSNTMPPASTLFTLLQEAPTIINVRDLFDAFRSRIEPAKEVNGAAHDENEEPDLKADMTQFYRALAELKMMGLVKSSTGTQVKRATRGRNAKSGTQDIDFVAKTSWAGL